MLKNIIVPFLIVILTCQFAGADSFLATIKQSANTSRWSAGAPWKIPSGYSQALVSGEKALNIYDEERDDRPDMSTVNESGPKAGRYLYRTHEQSKAKEGSALSVVDLKTGAARILAQDPSWKKVDGIRWTPWGTLLFGEEVPNGRLFEMKLNPDLVSGKVIHHTQVGRLSFEGIEIDTEGNIYFAEEGPDPEDGCGDLPCGGGLYKFVSDHYGDLSRGKLYVLKILQGNNTEGTGQSEWVGPISASNTRRDAFKHGGFFYQRPEDLERIGNILYAAVTKGTRDANEKQRYHGRVLAIDLNTLIVSDYVKPGLNVPEEVGEARESQFHSGLKKPDNLAETPDGHLAIIEDNKPSDIWIAQGKGPVADKVSLFASLSDPEAEGTGIYFSPFDPNTLYVNIQHSAAPDGDGTWAIRKTPSD